MDQNKKKGAIMGPERTYIEANSPVEGPKTGYILGVEVPVVPAKSVKPYPYKYTRARVIGFALFNLHPKMDQNGLFRPNNGPRKGPQNGPKNGPISRPPTDPTK